MNRLVAPSPTSRGRARTPRSWSKAQISTVLVLVIIGGGLSFLIASPHVPTQGPAARSGPIALAGPSTHGDLVVTKANSPFTIQSFFSNVYAEQGNITVKSGGLLRILNTTLTFEQYVGSTGNITQRLSHLYAFQVQGGAVAFVNSNLTTDVGILNAYPKLNFSIQNGSTVWVNHSTLEYPGMFYVAGSGTRVLVNNSVVTSNPAIGSIQGGGNVTNDSRYAPTLWVGGGAQFTLEQSQYLNYYANNLTKAAVGPGPIVDASPHNVSASIGFSWNRFPLTLSTMGLAQAVLYTGITGGLVTLNYTTATTQTGSARFNYTTSVPFASNFVFTVGTGHTSQALPPASIQQINAGGIAAFLSAISNNQIAFYISKTSSPSLVTVTSVTILLTPRVSFNLVASGAGTTFTAIDSTLDLNWTIAPGTLNAGRTAQPWESKKLVLNSSATAYLANLTVTRPFTQLYANQSIVLPDASSQAFFYRWLNVPVYGAGNNPIPGAQASTFYAYSSNQTSNTTANALNNLAGTNVNLAGYSQFVARSHGSPGYGQSDKTGSVRLLVATTWLTNSTLPDGLYLGTYHVGISVPSPPTVPVGWVYASTTPYPEGMHPGAPDASPKVLFSSYSPHPLITLTFTPPSSTLVPGNNYVSSGNVTFQGGGVAQITVRAVASGVNIFFGSTNVGSGPFTVTISPPSGMAAGTYTLNVTATVNGASATIFAVATVGGSSSTNFLLQKFLGLPLWMWIAIGASIAAVLATLFLFVIPRASRGKLVECGECGELIPETATACPKCGAEFEHELVRCSRCGSTIPASSKVCPECAAQLLGKPGETENDPERQGYGDFTERYRAVGKKELGDNYGEGAFWDWWKRQPTYLSFSQWKLQQAQGPRSGMSAPPADEPEEEVAEVPAYGGTERGPPIVGGHASPGIPSGARGEARASIPASIGMSAPSPAASAAQVKASPPPSNMRACSNCGKEIPVDYLVCPFCGAVTR